MPQSIQPHPVQLKRREMASMADLQKIMDFVETPDMVESGSCSCDGNDKAHHVDPQRAGLFPRGHGRYLHRCQLAIRVFSP